MREYAVVLLTAALVTYLATPVVRLVAVRLRMMAAPRDGRQQVGDACGDAQDEQVLPHGGGG